MREKLDTTDDYLQVIGARANNLKNIDISIPKRKLVVLTGLSGSGKSSLAIDTVYAEGQRQFIESLSLFSRQFFDQNSSSDVDEIVGLQPTVCINQHRGVSNPRSTVATTTEIYDYLRLLFAKTGEIRCPECDQPVSPQTIEQISKSIRSLPERTKLMVLAPMAVDRKGKLEDVIEKIRKERLVRIRVNGELFDIEEAPDLDASKNNSIDAVTDRIIVKEGIENRLFESIELATQLGDGAVCVSYKPNDQTKWSERFYSTRNACPSCGESCPHVTVRTFSFNSPHGACPNCSGLGQIESFDANKLIPDKNQPIESAIVIWNDLDKAAKRKQLKQLAPVLKSMNVDMSERLSDLTSDQLDRLLNSNDKQQLGLIVLLEKQLATTIDEDEQAKLESFRDSVTCTHCAGTRLNRYASSVFIDGKSIGDFTRLSLRDALDCLNSLEFDENDAIVAEPIVEEIRSRLSFLVQVGLEYLTLSRSVDTLSGGELQRVRLGKSIGNGLSGVCYVLDEPSIGLHARDNQKLIDTFDLLKERANSVLVVEHEESIIEAADHVIDVGPGAGTRGGQIIAQGSPEYLKSTNGLTGDYLAGRKNIQISLKHNEPAGSTISLSGASGFNLREVDLDLPIGRLTCVSGVSGSGKTTLVFRTLAPAIKKHFGLSTETPQPYRTISGLESLERIVEIDRRPIGRTPRGCAATYTGVLDDIRKIFAATKQAKQLGFTASRFSFNSKQGRCAECEGHGTKKVKMKFMPDVLVKCQACQGSRYNSKTLSAKFAGLSIGDVLKLSIDEAANRFDAFSSISARLHCLQQVGLGYLPLGQPATSLSGGEAQRIKLASELASKHQNRTLYLLDEPTTGLHFHDIQSLMNVLASLVEAGNTIVVVEHHLDVIRCADHVIDIGPGAGKNGGQIVASGPPHSIAQNEQSLTGKWLKKVLE